jgi:hypothetical protein
MTMVLSCVPVQYEVIPGAHPPVITNEHDLGECDDCGVDVWISSEHAELHELHPDGYVLFCRQCAGLEQALARERRKP